MMVALAEARAAYDDREVPVGCAFVSDGRVIARAHNDTNASFNATRHAEMVALDGLVELAREEMSTEPKMSAGAVEDSDAASPLLLALRARLARTTLYVTVEPCIMCADALRIAGVARVVFGAANDKFGGAGTVMSVLPNQIVSAGTGKAEAIALLKRFYGRANPSAPTAAALILKAAAAVVADDADDADDADAGAAQNKAETAAAAAEAFFDAAASVAAAGSSLT